MRTMYDAVTVANLPPGGDLYAGYIDGRYANVDTIRARFPTARVVVISVVGGTPADVLDVEAGDVKPAGAPQWVTWMRSLGRTPTIYCPRSLWTACIFQFNVQGVEWPNWWIAQYDNDPTIPNGAVAKQYGGNRDGGYDISSVADHWPGIDPEVRPMHDPAIPLRPYVADCAWLGGGALVLADDGSVYAFGGAPYAGDPSGEPYWVGRRPALIEVSKVPGKDYDVVATSGERYSYPA